MKALSAIILSIIGLFGIAQAALAISNGQIVSPNDSVKSVTVSIYSYDDDCTGVKVAPLRSGLKLIKMTTADKRIVPVLQTLDLFICILGWLVNQNERSLAAL